MTGKTSQSVQPGGTSTYTLKAENSEANDTSDPVVVTVGASITSFTVSPKTVAPGGQVTLSWLASGASGYEVAIKEPGSSSFETVSGANASDGDVLREAPTAPATNYVYTLRLQKSGDVVSRVSDALTVQ